MGHLLVRLLGLALAFALYAPLTHANETHYDLTIKKCRKNLSGTKEVSFALCVNGEIPAPTLRFIEGDTAVIEVHNLLDEETSIHWHGILLPNAMDGVSYVTTMPIKPHSSHTFRFPLRQHGTYWYHSHTDLQEQRGVYGGIVIQEKSAKKSSSDGFDEVLVLSDWTDENPQDVLAHLKKDGDYYALKKGRRASLFNAYQRGELNSYWQNEWERMGGMDLSDVGYDTFLINGKDELRYPFAPGSKGRLRIINAAASTYFYLQQGTQSLQVIAADGVDVVPVTTKELLIAMGETYDLLVQIPAKDSTLELRASAQDGSGYASAWLGEGKERLSPPPRALPSLYAMEHHSFLHEPSGSTHELEHSEHHGHHVGTESISPTLAYKDLVPLHPISYPEDAPTHNLRLELGGDMNRYNWFINGRTMAEEHGIDVRKGDIIRFQLVNETMMHHPMHLHGHFFKVISGSLSVTEKTAPLKHTVDVPPHQTVVIEFYADAPGKWLFHCHNLYHMKTGMARVVHYANFHPHDHELEKIADKDPHLHDDWYGYGQLRVFSNHGDLYARARNSRWHVDGTLALDHRQTFSSQGLLHRWWGNYFNAFAGGISQAKEASPLLGAEYLLPLRIWSQVSIDTIRGVNAELAKELVLAQQVTSQLTLGYSMRQGFEHEILLGYDVNWHLRLGIIHDSHNKFSLGASMQF